MSRNKSENRDESAVNAAVGGLLAWIAGKGSTTRGSSPTDGAAGEVISWVTGKGGKKDRNSRSR
ncbi:hypothetical protein [Streptacidiphilus sp. PAMC 29251]